MADTGKPAQVARQIDIPRGAANFRLFADLIKTSGTDFFEMDTPDGRGAFNYAVREPHGLVGVIAPWNLPLLLLTWKVAPALASGNTVIAKPSEETPATATLLAEVMDAAGVPPGVFNVVHGFGPNSAGERLSRHPGIDALTFTGESKTGAAIMKAAADTVKPLSFELGGKNAAVVFADADFEAAIEGTTRSVFANCGQVCLCSERVYVERPIFERFVAALKEQAEALVPADPWDDACTLGPLISAEHRSKVLEYFELARAEGAEVVTGGGVPSFGDERDAGFYVQPTIWTGLADGARSAREEIFGPVCHIAAVRQRGRGDRPGQRQRVRPCDRNLDQRPVACAPRGAAHRGRNLLGQLLVSPRSPNPVRWRQALRDRPGRRTSLARLLRRAEEHLCQALSPSRSRRQPFRGLAFATAPA